MVLIESMDGFSVGPVRIYYYSLCLLAAVWLGYWLALREAKRQDIAATKIVDIIVLAMVSGVVGARVSYVVQNEAYFSHHIGDIFRLTSGGLSIHGALIGGLIALWLYGRRWKIPLLKLTDTLVIPLLAGQIIGRLGNYFNQELFGYPTNLPWKMYVDIAHRPSQFLQFSYFQPTFLYEMLLNGLGLWLLWRYRPQKLGQLTALYLIIFSVSRFITEIFRISDRPFLSLSLAQIVSLILIGFGVWFIDTRISKE